ncbi:MAG: STAS domain-containing protein [Eggerthellaceae bacterium]
MSGVIQEDVRAFAEGPISRRHHAAGAALRWTGKRPAARRPGIEGDHGWNIAVDYFGGEAVLKLGGHLNTNTAADLEEALSRCSSARTRWCSTSPTWSTCRRRVCVLVATQKRVTAAEGALRIVNASDIREVFDITGLIDVFDVE